MIYWKQVIISVAVISLQQILCVEAYSSEAGPNVCDSMLPSHSNIPQTSQSPYIVTADVITYGANDVIQVTLGKRQASALPFRGFLLQARVIGTTTPIGTFGIIADSKSYSGCTPAMSAMTHTNSNEKSTMVFTWTAPSVAVGNLEFVVTFVQSYNTYWVKEKSAVITDSTSSVVTTASPVITDSTSSVVTTTSPVIIDSTAPVETTTSVVITDSTSSVVTITSPVITDSTAPVATSAVITDSTAPVETATSAAITDSTAPVETTTSAVITDSTSSVVTTTSAVITDSTSSVETATSAAITDSTAPVETTTSAVITDSTSSVVTTTSAVITDSTATVVTATTTVPVPTAVVLPVISVTGCGSTKGCYRSPQDCMDPDCDVLVTWQDEGNSVKFEMMGKTEGWVAVGLSRDQTMGDDAVTDCSVVSNSLLVRNSFNTGRSNAVLSGTDELRGLSAWKGGFIDGVVRCEFTKAKSSFGDKIFSLAEPYYLLIARGQMFQESKLKHVAVPAISAAKIDFAENKDHPIHDQMESTTAVVPTSTSEVSTSTDVHSTSLPTTSTPEVSTSSDVQSTSLPTTATQQTSSTSQRPVNKIRAFFKILNRVWTSSLGVKGSDEYNDLKKLLRELINAIFKNTLTSYLGVTDFVFSNGSISVTYLVVLAPGTTAIPEDVKRIMDKGLNSTNNTVTLGDLLLDPNAITFNSADENLPVDYCVEEIYECHPVATCYLHADDASYYCVCPAGYSGNGKTCRQDNADSSLTATIVASVLAGVIFIIVIVVIVYVLSKYRSSRQGHIRSVNVNKYEHRGRSHGTFSNKLYENVDPTPVISEAQLHNNGGFGYNSDPYGGI